MDSLASTQTGVTSLLARHADTCFANNRRDCGAGKPGTYDVHTRLSAREAHVQCLSILVFVDHRR